MREGGVIRSPAVFIGIGLNQEGYRQVLGVKLAGRESQTSWRDFLASLRDRGLHGVEFVASGAREGLRKSLREILPAKPTMTACRNSGGSMAGATYLRPRKTSPPLAYPLAEDLSQAVRLTCRRTSQRRSPSTACPVALTST